MEVKQTDGWSILAMHARTRARTHTHTHTEILLYNTVLGIHHSLRTDEYNVSSPTSCILKIEVMDAPIPHKVTHLSHLQLISVFLSIVSVSYTHLDVYKRQL